MTNATILVVIALLGLFAFAAVRQRSVALVSGSTNKLHSLPRYHGYFAAVMVTLPSLLVLLLWLASGKLIVENLVLSGLPDDIAAANAERLDLLINRIRLVAENGAAVETDEAILAAAEQFNTLYRRGIAATLFLAVGVAAAGYFYAANKVDRKFRARAKYEQVLLVVLAISSFLAIGITIGIVASLIFESLRFFQQVPLDEFIFGLKWSPQTALRADQIAAEGSFGAVPLFAGTFLISLVAMCVAGPVGLLSAIYLTQYAGPVTRGFAKPLLEILAGIPTVVYGFFAALTVAPMLREFGSVLGLDVASESALAAGLVMGIMIIPFVSSLSDDAITAVPDSIKQGSLALGATPAETIVRVIVPAALPGIVSSFLLAISRAVGETMIVVMAAGMRPNLTANPLEAVTTVTVQIVALLTGDQEFNSAKTLSAFALGLALFVTTLIFNIFALRIVRRYRQVYD